MEGSVLLSHVDKSKDRQSPPLPRVPPCSSHLLICRDDASRVYNRCWQSGGVRSIRVKCRIRTCRDQQELVFIAGAHRRDGPRDPPVVRIEEAVHLTSSKTTSLRSSRASSYASLLSVCFVEPGVVPWCCKQIGGPG